MNTIINHSQYNPPRKGHCITLYIVSLIALTFGVVLSIAIPCYLHSTFHANRQYNKIVRRVNKEISDTHINQDLFSIMTNDMVKYFEYASRKAEIYNGLMYNGFLLSQQFEIQPSFQSTKSLLQAQIAQILIKPKDEQMEFGYVKFQPFYDLELGQQIFCVCDDTPCNDVEEFKGAVDILFEPGHFCDLDKKSVFSEKTIDMIEDFVKDFVEEYDDI